LNGSLGQELTSRPVSSRMLSIIYAGRWIGSGWITMRVSLKYESVYRADKLRYWSRRVMWSIYAVGTPGHISTPLRSAHLGMLAMIPNGPQLTRQEGKAYNCFCTPDEAQAIKMTLKSQGDKRNYDGRCSHLTEEDVGRRKRAGHKHVVRFKVKCTPTPGFICSSSRQYLGRSIPQTSSLEIAIFLGLEQMTISSS
jgi:hypothetical protein